MTHSARKWNRFKLLRLKSQPSGPLITFVRCDFDEKHLTKLMRNVRYLTESNEYSFFSSTYNRRNVNFLGTGSGPASLLTALYELLPSKIESLVRIGASGGLNGARIHEVVNVTTALCMDAVSSTLAGTDRVAANLTLAKSISEALSTEGVKSSLESAVSVDSMYLFEKNIERAEAQGAYCWDLETATTLAFGKKFDLRTSSVLYVVSDKARNRVRSYPPIQKLRFVSSVLEALSI
jgi:uridine phosphorylase